MNAKYFSKDIVDDAVGTVVLIVFSNNTVDYGWLLETKNLPEKCRYFKSPYCLLPLSSKRGMSFFSLKNIREMVYVNNRYILPKTLRERKARMKEPIKTDKFGRVINHVMPFDEFQALLEEAEV